MIFYVHIVFVLAKHEGSKLDLALEIDRVLTSEPILYVFLAHNLGSSLGLELCILHSVRLPEALTT